MLTNFTNLMYPVIIDSVILFGVGSPPPDLTTNPKLVQVNSQMLQNLQELADIYKSLEENSTIRATIQDIDNHKQVVQFQLSEYVSTLEQIQAAMRAVEYASLREAVLPVYNTLMASVNSFFDVDVLRTEIGKCRILSQLYNIVGELTYTSAIR